MIIKVYTESSSLYTFQQEDDQVTFSLKDLDLLTGKVREGGELKGIVTKVNQPLLVGGIVNIGTREYDLWGNLKKKEDFLRSARITRIEIDE